MKRESCSPSLFHVSRLKAFWRFFDPWKSATFAGAARKFSYKHSFKESILKAVLAYIEELRDHHMPLLRVADMHELRLAHETANMILSAEMKLKASLMRTESRCSHYRLDYPDQYFGQFF